MIHCGAVVIACANGLTDWPSPYRAYKHGGLISGLKQRVTTGLLLTACRRVILQCLCVLSPRPLATLSVQ